MSALRTTLAAVANTEAVDPSEPMAEVGLLADVQRKQLSEDDNCGIVARERHEHCEAAQEIPANAAEFSRRAAIRAAVRR